VRQSVSIISVEESDILYNALPGSITLFVCSPQDFSLGLLLLFSLDFQAAYHLSAVTFFPFRSDWELYKTLSLPDRWYRAYGYRGFLHCQTFTSFSRHRQHSSRSV